MFLDLPVYQAKRMEAKTYAHKLVTTFSIQLHEYSIVSTIKFLMRNQFSYSKNAPKLTAKWNSKYSGGSSSGPPLKKEEGERKEMGKQNMGRDGEKSCVWEKGQEVETGYREKWVVEGVGTRGLWDMGGEGSEPQLIFDNSDTASYNPTLSSTTCR